MIFCSPMTIRFLISVISLAALASCGGGGGSSGSGSAGGGDGGGMGGSAASQVNYYNAAKPLIDRYCVSCHHSGDTALAPFPLETHKQVQGKLSAMVYSLEADTMPPLGYADLGADDTSLLLSWLNDGAPKGDPADEPVRAEAAFTYHGDARAIIEEKCVACHQQGGIAPFPLDSLADIRAVAAAAAYSIENGTMPPWPPTRGYTTYQHDRSLSEEQRYVLLNWLNSDMVAGETSDYVALEIEQFEQPDYNLDLQLPQAYTPTLQPDDHRCFAIEWPLDEFSYVTAVDVIPDAVEQVHHVIVSIAEPGDAGLYYAAGGQDGSPGWYCLGAGGVRGAPLPRQIGGWVPGAGREPAPAGTGIGVKPGSVMVVQMHYNTLITEPRPDQSRIQVATSPEVERPSRSFLLPNPAWLRKGGMPIAAGDANARHEFTVPASALAALLGGEIGLTGKDPWVLHQGFVHMHNLGSSGRTTLIREDGTEQVLLDIRDWDFNWQSTYNFEREVLINRKDRIKLECTWDNSQENQEFVNGEQLTAQYVEWGDGTQDEMCLMSLLMTHPAEGRDYSYQPSVYLESPTYRQQFVPGDLVPLQLVLNNFTLHEPGLHDHSDPDQHEDMGHGTAEDDHSGVYAGHYHLYLDTEDDEAEHLTAWDPLYYYELPADLEPGLHTLRISLRGEDHHALGIEHEVEIEVVADRAEQRLALTDVLAWTSQKAGRDSLADHRPTSVECPENSYYAEGQALEVETGYCNYLSLVQPTLGELKSGDTVHLVLWHGDLAFDEPASAHVAVTIGDRLLWETEVAIPTRAQIYDVRIPVEFDALEGSEVQYHLHNHGYNSWTLLQLEVER
jgi:mono/diheme cytochrome c family protein